ncbi:hypothetical protein KO494_12575 [Lacinutrix sp. C3R15]|nr:hypothetical protein [Lacinutrix sp. C3R15]MDO6623693.1 hypothetical protein [Oceanihabitans sp. 1_MG-2023]
MNSVMENSLCSTCKFNNDCSLTSNKNFIWSCSEFEVTTTNNLEQQKGTTKNAFEYQATEYTV